MDIFIKSIYYSKLLSQNRKEQTITMWHAYYAAIFEMKYGEIYAEFRAARAS